MNLNQLTSIVTVRLSDLEIQTCWIFHAPSDADRCVIQWMVLACNFKEHKADVYQNVTELCKHCIEIRVCYSFLYFHNI